MHRLHRVVFILGMMVFLACANQASSQAVTPETDDQKTLYALGMAIAQNLTTFELTEEELAYVQAGLADTLLDREEKVSLEEFGPKIQEMAQTRMAAATEREKAEGMEFATTEAGKDGAQKMESGVIYTEITAGTGESPEPSDVVSVHYTGMLRDGTTFDSSVERGQPAKFRLDQVVSCWTEGVGQMKVGGKARLVCPPDTAYGDRGAPPRIPPGATLVFEVELLGIEETPAAPAMPAQPQMDGEMETGNDGGGEG